MRVDDVAAVERLGHRVDRQVARREVALERPPDQRREVDLPGVAGPDDAPAAELVGQLEGGAARGPRQPPRGAARVAVDGDVEVVAGLDPIEQPVADGAAHEPRALVAERVAQRLDHRGEAPSRWYARGTRRLMAHVTS